MEPVLIQSVEDKPTDKGVYRAVVKTDVGVMACWDMALGAILKNFIGHRVQLELHRTGAWTNIKAMGAEVAPTLTPQPIVATPTREAGLSMSMREQSIVAQVCVKGAIELARMKDFKNNEELGEFLCMAVNEIAGSYKVALSSLE